MEVSVVVPTRDRPVELGRCLAALRGQGDEIVVVDDGSVERARVASIAQSGGARLVRLEGEGPAAARNAGARAACGEAICFTDDDCEPASSWARTAAAPILAGERACAAGRTLAAPGASAADRAWQAIANHLQRAALDPRSPSPGFAPTCNLACAASLLAELPFDESFPLAAGEDRDWAARATARGAAPLFVPEAVVLHRPRLTPRSFLRQQLRYGRGAARFRAAAPGRRIGAPSFYASLLKAGIAEGAAPGLLVAAAQLATAAGAAAEWGWSAPRPGGYSKRRLD